MRQILMSFLRVFRFPLLLMTATLPVSLTLIMHFAPDRLSLAWIFPLCYLVLDLLGTRVRGKLRVPYSLFGMAVLMAFGLFTVKLTQQMPLLAVSGLYAVLFAWGMITSTQGRYERISLFWYFSGILLHIAAQLMLYSDRVTNTHALDAVSPWITGSFYLFAAIAMLSVNQTSLSFAASGRQSVSETMRRKNAVLTLVFFGIAALLSLIPSLTTVVSRFFLWIISVVLWLISLLDKGQFSDSSGSSGQMDQGDMLQGLGKGQTAEIWNILTVIVGIATVVLLVVLIVYGLYKLIRKLPHVLHAIMRLLNRYVTAVSEDYVDEVTDTRDFDEKDRIVKTKRQRVDERKLPPDQRIRYRYLNLMIKRKWSKGSTARENLPEYMAPLYERARYSNHAVTEEEAQRFAADAKRV